MKHANPIALVIAIALVAGCEESGDVEGPLARASSSDSIVTSTANLSPTPRLPVKDEPRPDSSVVEDKSVSESTLGDDNGEIHAVHEEAFVAEPFLQDEGAVTIHRLVSAPMVEAREPIGASSRFAHDEPTVYAFVDVENASNEPADLEVFFIAPSGKVTGGVVLEVPAKVSRWRTWAYTRHANEPGMWRIEVRSREGALLGSLPFEVAEGC